MKRHSHLVHQGTVSLDSNEKSLTLIRAYKWKKKMQETLMKLKLMWKLSKESHKMQENCNTPFSNNQHPKFIAITSVKLQDTLT